MNINQYRNSRVGFYIVVLSTGQWYEHQQKWTQPLRPSILALAKNGVKKIVESA